MNRSSFFNICNCSSHPEVSQVCSIDGVRNCIVFNTFSLTTIVFFKYELNVCCFMIHFKKTKKLMFWCKTMHRQEKNHLFYQKCTVRITCRWGFLKFFISENSMISSTIRRLVFMLWCSKNT